MFSSQRLGSFFSKGKLGGKEQHKTQQIWGASGGKGRESFKERGDLATREDGNVGFSLPPSVCARDGSRGDLPSFSSDDPTFSSAEPQQLRRGFHRLRRGIGAQRGAELALAWESVDEVSESSECSHKKRGFGGEIPLTPQKCGDFPSPRKPRRVWGDFCSYWIVHPASHTAPRCGLLHSVTN